MKYYFACRWSNAQFRGNDIALNKQSLVDLLVKQGYKESNPDQFDHNTDGGTLFIMEGETID